LIRQTLWSTKFTKNTKKPTFLPNIPHFQLDPGTVIPEAVLIGNPSCNMLKSGSPTKDFLISVNLPPSPKTVIPEEILIGNPVSNQLKSWIPDEGIRG
jgi:hypothetical protein